MAEWVKALATKSYVLRVPQSCCPLTTTYALWETCPCTCTHIEHTHNPIRDTKVKKRMRY